MVTGRFSPQLRGTLGFVLPYLVDGVTGGRPGPQPFLGVRSGLSGCGVRGWACSKPQVSVTRPWLLAAPRGRRWEMEAESGSGRLARVRGGFCRGLARWLEGRMAPGAPWSGPKSPRANCKLVVTVGLEGAWGQPEAGSG